MLSRGELRAVKPSSRRAFDGKDLPFNEITQSSGLSRTMRDQTHRSRVALAVRLTDVASGISSSSRPFFIG
jgi:hypothetical protein